MEHNIPSLAKAVGVDERTVRRWMQRTDWPFGPIPPWNAHEVGAWRTATFAPAAQPPDEIDDQIKRAKLARAVHDARSAKVAADLAEKAVYPAPEVNQDTLRHIYAARNAMLAIGHEAAFELQRQCGVDPEKAEKIIRGICRRILSDMARGWGYEVSGAANAPQSLADAPYGQSGHPTTPEATTGTEGA